MRRPLLLTAVVSLLASAAFACDSDDSSTVTVYAGRSEELVGPLLERFTDETGIEIAVRYGDTTELANLLLTEGDRSDADVFFSQDAGALGALEAQDLLAELDGDLLDEVDARFRAPSGNWIGISGRARVIVYNTDEYTEDTVPASYTDLTSPEYEGMVGWAPTNASFQTFVTAIRELEGDEAATAWLEAMKANGAVEYPGNSQIVEAVANGEVTLGLVNHYYVFRFLDEQGEGFKARNAFSVAGNAGSLINVAGAAVLATNDSGSSAERFIEFLLSQEAQEYFRDETHEYPLAAGVAPRAELPALSDLNTPELALGNLADLEGTLDLMRDAGVIP